MSQEKERFLKDLNARLDNHRMPVLNQEGTAFWAYLEGLKRARGVAIDYGQETFNAYEPKDIANRIDKVIGELSQ